jgi:MFS family permease
MSRRRVQALAALATVGISGYSSVAIPVLAGSLEADLNLGKATLGLLLSLGMGGGCVGGFAAGWVADRVDALRSLRLFTAVAAVGCATAALGGFEHALLGPGLVAIGLGAGGAYVAAGGLLGALFPHRRRGSFSGLMVTNAAAGMVFPGAVSWLNGLWQRGELPLSWVLAGPYALVAVAMLLLTALLGGAPAAPPAAADAPAASPARGRLDPRAVIVIIALATIHGTSDGVLYCWIARYLEGRFPEPAFPPGLVLSFYAAAYMTGRLALTFLPDKVGRTALVVVPGLLAGPIVFAALRAPSIGLTAAGYAVAALLYGLEFPSLMGLASQRYPERFSMIFGWVSGATVVTMVAVWGVGRWTQSTGTMLPALSIAAYGFVLFGLIAALWVVADRRASAHR